MAEAGEQADPEALAGLGDTPHHREDTAPAKQLELGLEPRLALLSASLFSSDTITTLQTKHRPMSLAALSPFRMESV
jgi:hypothetical protein